MVHGKTHADEPAKKSMAQFCKLAIGEQHVDDIPPMEIDLQSQRRALKGAEISLLMHSQLVKAFTHSTDNLLMVLRCML